MPSPEFERRLNDYLDGDLDEAGREALQQEVERDGAARAVFDTALRLESLLAAAHSPEAAEERILRGLERRLDEGKVVRHVAFRWWPALTAAAAVLIALAVTWWNRPWRQAAGPHQVLAGSVQVDGRVVQRLSDGSTLLVVGEEPAVIKLADGSRVEFLPGTAAAIKGPQAALRQVVALASGTGHFRVDRGANQFRVVTPLGQVTVLGTEFSVALRPAAEVEAMQSNEIVSSAQETMKPQTNTVLALAVAVTVGQVQVDVGSKTYTLSAGQTAYAKEGELRALREMTGELTRVEAQSITVTLRKDSGARDETFQVTATTRFELETGEMETVTGGKEGRRSRVKTVEGQASDLKAGQRVRVQYEGGVATRVVVIQVRARTRGGEGERERERAPEDKPRSGGDREGGKAREPEKPGKNG